MVEKYKASIAPSTLGLHPMSTPSRQMGSPVTTSTPQQRQVDGETRLPSGMTRTHARVPPKVGTDTETHPLVPCGEHSQIVQCQPHSPYRFCLPLYALTRTTKLKARPASLTSLWPDQAP